MTNIHGYYRDSDFPTLVSVNSTSTFSTLFQNIGDICIRWSKQDLLSLSNLLHTIASNGNRSVNLHRSTINSSETDLLQRSIISSSFFHYFSAWDFYERAWHSALFGDFRTTVFLCYYSELRAVLSLLATQGISGLNSYRYCFDNLGDLHIHYAAPTHKAVYEIAKEWSNNINYVENLLYSLKFENRSFTEWINASGYSTSPSSATSLLSGFFRDYLFDLALYRADRTARNNASYDFFGDNGFRKGNVIDLINYNFQLVHYCEPNNSDGMYKLMFHLLRNLLYQISLRQHSTYNATQQK